MLGQRVNNFEIVRLLGEGGMGAVYEAKHLVIRRRVAVKVLRPELALDAETVQRFFNEARATSAIRHPNIVEVVDVGTLPDGIPFLVMELLEGESLADRLDRTPRLEIPMALDFMRQSANALQAAHETGIVHRDLKPENLFLVPDQRFPERELVKVLDFGIAKLLADVSVSPVQTMAGAVFGTPPYMSPEQCRESSSGVDHRTDIYALGIILYETLCGQLPFEAESIGSLMMLHMSETPVPPSQLRAEVPPHIECAILKALAKDREDRFANMTEFRDALGPSPVPILKIVSDSPSPPAAASLTSPLVPAPAATKDAPTPMSVATAAERTPRARQHPARSVLAVAAAAGLLLFVAWLAVPRTAPATVERTERATAAVAAVAPGSGSGSVAGSGSGSVAGSGSAAGSGSGERAAAAANAATPPGEAAPPRATPAAATRAPQRAKPHRARAEEATPTSAASQPPVATEVATTSASAEGVKTVHDPQTTAPAAEPGYLSFDSAPWSDVFLGTKLLGTTPLIHVALPPGKHLLTLKNSELGTSTSYMIEIQSGKTVSRLVGWEKVK